MFSTLKSVDQKVNKTIYGFFRDHAKRYKSAEIPECIKKLILLYYYQNEQFGKCGDGLEILSSDQGKMKCIIQATEAPNLGKNGCRRFGAMGFSWVYGTQVIEPKQFPNSIYKWKFMFDPHFAYHDISIGFTSSTDTLNRQSYTPPRCTYYSIIVSDGDICGSSSDRNSINIYYDVCESGEVVQVEFDIKNRNVTYQIGNGTKQIGFNNIDLNQKYNLFMEIERGSSFKAEIIEFKVEDQ